MKYLYRGNQAILQSPSWGKVVSYEFSSCCCFFFKKININLWKIWKEEGGSWKQTPSLILLLSKVTLTLVLLLAFIFAFSADEIVVASIDGVREEEQDDEGGVDDDNREDESEDEEGSMRDWVWGNGCGVVIPVIGVCSEGEDGDDVCGEDDGWVIVEETGVKGREGAIKLEEEEIKGWASKYNNNNNKWKMENRKWEMEKKSI